MNKHILKMFCLKYCLFMQSNLGSYKFLEFE